MKLLLILIIIVCILLILFVLLQNSKGGGLAANFASAQIMGVRKTADLLERGTWILASSLVVLCILSTLIISRGNEVERKSVIKEQVNNTPDQGMPALPQTPDSAK